MSHFVLLVEDNPDDAFLMRRALKKTGLELPLHLATDGQIAIDYLRGANEFSDREKYPLPAVVFLDLKLPFVTGFQVLEWIRDHPTLHDLNVVILTSSAEDRDFKRAKQLGVIAYLVKPPEPETLKNTLRPLLEPATVAS